MIRRTITEEKRQTLLGRVNDLIQETGDAELAFKKGLGEAIAEGLKNGEVSYCNCLHLYD